MGETDRIPHSKELIPEDGRSSHALCYLNTPHLWRPSPHRCQGRSQIYHFPADKPPRYRRAGLQILAFSSKRIKCQIGDRSCEETEMMERVSCHLGRRVWRQKR